MSYGTWPANAPPWPYFYFPPFSPQDLNPGAASGSNVGSSRSSGGGVSRTSILTPSIVAIVALLGSAFLIVSYYRVFAKYCTAWQIFWGLRQPDRGSSSSSDQHQSGNRDLEQGWMLHNSGLDEALVRKIPVYVFKTGEGVVGSHECAVCLGEFEDDDELRLLPKCSHAFHVACIDMWLRSHSNCPLCRAFIVVPQPQQMTRIQHEDDQQPEPEQIQGAAAAEEQQQVEQPIASLQIEPASSMHSDHERDASEFPDSQQQPVDLLRRSLSLELGRHHHHHRRGRRKTRLPQMLRRSHSTGSIPFNYLVSSSLASNNPDSAEFDKNFIHSSSDEYVVLNVELGCSSTSSSQWVSIDKDEKLDNLNPSPLHSMRKSRSFRASALMRRSLSASGRVFSFRSFGRSKSNTNALGDRQSQV